VNKIVSDSVIDSAVGDRKSYWNKFYSANQNTVRLLVPSLFAAFVANELDRSTTIIDVRCCCGRSSVWLSAA